jgi:hypothetical protein
VWQAVQNKYRYASSTAQHVLLQERTAIFVLVLCVFQDGRGQITVQQPHTLSVIQAHCYLGRCCVADLYITKPINFAHAVEVGVV